MRATADSWKREPFSAGIAIPYAERFSESEWTRLQEGFVPKRMEDKWFVYFDEPYLFFHRSWTGKPVYRVRFSANTDGVTVTEALYVSNLLEATEAAYQVKLLDFLISNVLLAKARPFPLPTGLVEPAKGVVQHGISGTGYPQANRSSGTDQQSDPMPN